MPTTLEPEPTGETLPPDRLLSTDGRESIIHRADDLEAERRAWAAVRAAMR